MRQYLVLALFAAIGYAVVWYAWPSKDDGKARDDVSPPTPPPSDRSDGADAAWFQVLGVTEDARTEEITRAYRSLIAQYHPDRVARMGPEIRQLAEEKSQQINSAYEFGVALRRFGR